MALAVLLTYSHFKNNKKMEKKNYVEPHSKVRVSALRASILAGSNGTVEAPVRDGDAINGENGGSVTGKDFEFGARQRSSLD